MPTSTQPMIVEADPALLQDRKMQMVDVVLQPTKDGTAQVSLVNCLGFTQKIEGGMDIGSTQSACPGRKGQLQIRWGL